MNIRTNIKYTNIEDIKKCPSNVECYIKQCGSRQPSFSCLICVFPPHYFPRSCCRVLYISPTITRCHQLYRRGSLIQTKIFHFKYIVDVSFQICLIHIPLMHLTVYPLSCECVEYPGNCLC